MRYFTLTILAVLLTFSAALAQSGDVVLFTSGGEQFYAVLNGVKQNADPQTNLKISDLNAPNYKLTLIFDDQSLQPMQGKNLYVKPGMMVTYEVKKNKKGAWVLRFISEYPLETAPQAAGTTTVVYTTTEPTSTSTTTYTEPASTTTVTESTTTSTTVGGDDGMGGSMSMDVNVNDGMGGENVSMDINVNVSDPNLTGGTTSTSTTTTTTTTTTSSATTIGGTYTDNTSTHYTTETGGYTPGYSGDIGCAIPMNDGDFESAKGSVASKTFSDSKMTIAKQVAQANCLTADQVKQLVALFDFEDDRLEYAKYAYQFTYDRGNYYKINDAFEFETTIMELDRYIESYNNR